MNLAMEQDQRKRELEEIKVQKKEQSKENKATCLLAKEQKEHDKIEREIACQEK